MKPTKKLLSINVEVLKSLSTSEQSSVKGGISGGLLSDQGGGRTTSSAPVGI